MDGKEQVIWARAYNDHRDKGASDVEAILAADRATSAVIKEVAGVSDSAAKTSARISNDPNHVVDILNQCVRASFVDASAGAGSALVALLGFAAQRQLEPPVAQAQHHHVQCEITKIPSNMMVGVGNSFTWKEHNPTSISPSYSGVTTNLVPGNGRERDLLGAIVYGPCPSIGAVVTFDSPAITMNGEEIVVSQVFGRVIAVLA